MDYTQLTGSSSTPGSIARWINYSQVQGDAPEIVIEAESWIYRRLRHWKMLTPPTAGSLTVGQDYLTNPADMLEPFLLVTTGQYFQEIVQKPMQEVVANWAYTGTGNTRVQQQPLMFAFNQDQMQFDSPPDQAYTYAFIYYQQPEPLSVSITNFLTQTYPRLLRCACMAAACEFAKDNGQGQYDRTYWDQLAQDEIDKAQAESDRARRGTVAGAILIGGGVASNFPGYVTGYG
jgi:hypothetical protein